MLEIGYSYTSSCVVNSTTTAETLGSGNMAVFATPAMVALMENAAMNAVGSHLDEGATTVGTHISVSHVRATGLEQKVTAKATLTQIEGRKLSFTVTAEDEDGVIGEGNHTRFIVERERFLNKIKK